jgi:hypothetical protein
VKDITQLDSWVISAQGRFTKNTDLFPGKISTSLNGCPRKAVVRDDHWYFTKNYLNKTCFNCNADSDILGLENDLLKVVLQQMNMTFKHVPSPVGFEMTDNLIRGMLTKKTDRALGGLGTNVLSVSYFDSTKPY